jgi:hypothetical protein
LRWSWLPVTGRATLVPRARQCAWARRRARAMRWGRPRRAGRRRARSGHCRTPRRRGDGAGRVRAGRVRARPRRATTSTRSRHGRSVHGRRGVATGGRLRFRRAGSRGRCGRFRRRRGWRRRGQPSPALGTGRWRTSARGRARRRTAIAAGPPGGAFSPPLCDLPADRADHVRVDRGDHRHDTSASTPSSAARTTPPLASAFGPSWAVHRPGSALHRAHQM